MSYLPNTRVIIDENGELEHYSEAMLTEQDRQAIWCFDYAVERALYELSESEFYSEIPNGRITVYPHTEDFEDFIEGMEVHRNDLIVGMIDGTDALHDALYEERVKEFKEIGEEAFRKKYCFPDYKEQFAYYLKQEEEE